MALMPPFYILFPVDPLLVRPLVISRPSSCKVCHCVSFTLTLQLISYGVTKEHLKDQIWLSQL